MIDRLFGPRVTVAVSITGYIEGQRVRWSGSVRLRAPATVGDALRAAGKAARVDLVRALERGEQPILLLDGMRLEAPLGLGQTLKEGMSLNWLQPMVGG